MLITNNLIYIELHKTGCTHTRSILSDIFADSHTIIGKHNSYNRIPKNILGNFEEKIKIGNIRNPWDWYVSLWAFGCQQKGGLYGRLTQNQRLLSKVGIKNLANRMLKNEDGLMSRDEWQKLYSDSKNIDNFNTWLRSILTDKNIEVGGYFTRKSISNFAGLLTYRYLTLYTYNGDQLNNIKSVTELNQFDAKENFMDIIIKSENIHEQLIQLSDRLNFDASKLEEILQTKYKNRTNSSKRNHDYKTYYNDASISLVEKKEQLIIDKYGYHFE